MHRVPVQGVPGTVVAYQQKLRLQMTHDKCRQGVHA